MLVYKTVQLLRRHWIFENALGEIFEVKGSGVVGEKPKIKPGDYLHLYKCNGN